MNHEALKRVQDFLRVNGKEYSSDCISGIYSHILSERAELRASDIQALVDIAIGAAARADEAEELRKIEASQAKAWREVWQLLEEVPSEITRAKGTGLECALAAIRSLVGAAREEDVFNTSTVRFSCVGEAWHLQTQGGATLMRGVGEEFEVTIRGSIK